MDFWACVAAPSLAPANSARLVLVATFILSSQPPAAPSDPTHSKQLVVLEVPMWVANLNLANTRIPPAADGFTISFRLPSLITMALSPTGLMYPASVQIP